jgi:hypothetical protein
VVSRLEENRSVATGQIELILRAIKDVFEIEPGYAKQGLFRQCPVSQPVNSAIPGPAIVIRLVVANHRREFTDLKGFVGHAESPLATSPHVGSQSLRLFYLRTSASQTAVELQCLRHLLLYVGLLAG